MHRVAPFALLVSAVGLVAAILWTESLLASRPRVGGFTDGPISCFSVLETPSGGAHKTPRRDLDDQARLPRADGSPASRYYDDDLADLSGEVFADDCNRARTARVATVAALGGPLTVIALLATIASLVPTVGLVRRHLRTQRADRAQFSSLTQLRDDPAAGTDPSEGPK